MSDVPSGSGPYSGPSGSSGGLPHLPAPSGSSSRSKRKRCSQVGGTGIYSGVSNSLENKDVEFLCPICFEMLSEAHMTKCGHTFCYNCILRSLEQSNRCPKCNFHLENKNQIFPNFILNELVAKKKNSLDMELKKKCLSKMDLSEILTESSGHLSLPDVNLMLDVLSTRRDQLQAESYLTQQRLLTEFLTHLKRLKENQLFALQRQVSTIENDIAKVSQNIEEFKKTNGDGFSSFMSGEQEEESNNVVPNLEGFNTLKDKSLLKSNVESTLPQRRKRMHHHFDDLTKCYFSSRVKEMTFPPVETPTTSNADTHPKGEPDFAGLDTFSTCLSKFTRYNTVRPLATLSYTTDMFNNASIVSSIEFDKDNEFFAIAGVTKRIKIYDYNVVLKDMVDIHYPSMEMICNSKISCISWSSFHKGTLVSSDYEGTVIVWDANTSQKIRIFQEHEKRCWSVDFNLVDTKLIASGSDDARVKLWSTNINHSIASLEAKANVCCVKFNPSSCYHLAFGSADHCVHYYDLRNTKNALNIFKGHRKAVSYVKFLNSEDIVSASTDSQLKLWNVNNQSCLRSFTGHVNEKNFVGLATDGDYVTCGSENNGLYIYYKGLSKHLFNFKFDAVKTLLERDRKDEEVNEFVSAVCWRQGTNVIVAANSQGTIKVLELV